MNSGDKRTGKKPSYRGWTAEPARTWVSRRWSRTLFSERRRGPAGGQTWSSVDLGVVVFYFSLTFLLFLSVVLSSFFGLSSYAFQVCGQLFVKTLGWFGWKKETRYLAFSSVDGFTFLCFQMCVALGYRRILWSSFTCVFSESTSPARTHTYTQRCAERAATTVKLWEKIQSYQWLSIQDTGCRWLDSGWYLLSLHPCESSAVGTPLSAVLHWM